MNKEIKGFMNKQPQPMQTRGGSVAKARATPCAASCSMPNNETIAAFKELEADRGVNKLTTYRSVEEMIAALR